LEEDTQPQVQHHASIGGADDSSGDEEGGREGGRRSFRDAVGGRFAFLTIRRKTKDKSWSKSLEALQQCFAEVESQLDEEGLYRIAGQSSEYMALYRNRFEMHSPKKLTPQTDITTVTSAVKVCWGGWVVDDFLTTHNLCLPLSSQYFFRNMDPPLFTADQQNEMLAIARTGDLSSATSVATVRKIIWDLPAENRDLLRLGWYLFWALPHFGLILSFAPQRPVSSPSSSGWE